MKAGLQGACRGGATVLHILRDKRRDMYYNEVRMKKVEPGGVSWERTGIRAR